MKLRIFAGPEVAFGALVNLLRLKLPLSLVLAGEWAKSCRGGFDLEEHDDLLLDLGVELEKIGCRVELK